MSIIYCSHDGRMCPGDSRCDCNCDSCTVNVVKAIIKDPDAEAAKVKHKDHKGKK
jgi:hypothetical protein